MSGDAPCTHPRKRHLGCQTKKRSGAPSALKRSLTGGFFLTCRIDRLIPLAALCLITCIATILNPDNGPLFMVAGDSNAAVGTTIGFVGDVIIPGHVAESVLRASLVYTIAWIPAAAIMGVTAVGVGTAETTAQLSQAKGVPGGAAALARVIPQTIALSLAYLLSCAVAFTLKTLTFGPPLTEAAWGTALAITLTNCLLLCAIHLASALIAAVCRMPLLALFLSLLISIGPLLAYPREYIAGSTPMVAWMSPTVRLMHTRGTLCDGRPSGLAGARHIALATGSWRPSRRITSRTGPLRRHRRRDCNRAEPAGGAIEPPRGSPRVARAPACTRLDRQRIIRRLRARAVPPHPQPRCGVRDHGGRLHRRLRGATLVPNDDIADSRRALDAHKQCNRPAYTRPAGARLFGNHRRHRARPLRAHAAITAGQPYSLTCSNRYSRI